MMKTRAVQDGPVMFCVCVCVCAQQAMNELDSLLMLSITTPFPAQFRNNYL